MPASLKLSSANSSMSCAHAAEPSTPKSYSSRPGTASKSAAPLGSTPRTTTARRAQPFSPKLLRRSSSTSRPFADWLTR
eukprot:scaffold131623_cov48-Phaeocystis_antarctica.AAC.1